MRKPMPFPKDIAPKVCANPDCKIEGRHSKECTIRKTDDGRLEFKPTTPWQELCCTKCRMHRHYLRVIRPKIEAERNKSEGEIGESPIHT